MQSKMRTQSGSKFTQNAIYSLVGNVLPIIVAIVAIPILLRELGLERFGFLTMSWALVGYLGLLDLGLGRALTKNISEHIASNDQNGARAAFVTGVATLTGVGIVVMLIFLAVGPYIVERFVRLNSTLMDDALQATIYLAISMPFVMLVSGLKGAIEAHGAFAQSAVLRTINGTLNYLAPLLALFFDNTLATVILFLTISKFIGIVTYFAVALKQVAGKPRWSDFSINELRLLAVFGGWLSVSNIISPIMTNLDRFLLGIFVSVELVAYYSTPMEMISKLAFVPEAIVSVVFPAIVAHSVNNRQHAQGIYVYGFKMVFVLLLVPVSILVLFGRDLLTLWLGLEFSFNSYRVLQILAIGLWINGLARVAFNVIQGMGRPDLTARVHILEVLPFLSIFYILVMEYSYLGAAIAWFVRVAVDAVIMFMLAGKSLVLPIPAKKLVPALCAVALLIPIGQLEITDVHIRVLTMLAAITAILLLVVLSLFRRDEIQQIWSSVHGKLQRRKSNETL